MTTDTPEMVENNAAPLAPLDLQDRAHEAALSVLNLAALGAPDLAVEGPQQLEARLLPVLEGLIFAADHPLSVKEMLVILHDVGDVLATEDMLGRVLERLREKHTGGGLLLTEVAGGFALRTGPAASRYLQRANQDKPFRMGRAALETLAIVAYRQPVTKAQIDDIRGVDSSGALKALLDKNMVRVLGKAEEVGRPLLYGTTKTFLEAFNLRVLSDLPTLREYQELSEENQAKVDAQAPAQQLGRIRDLAQPGARMVSADVEAEGSEALHELDRALGDATLSTRTAEALLKAGGRLPPGLDIQKLVRGAEASLEPDGTGDEALSEEPPVEVAQAQEEVAEEPE